MAVIGIQAFENIIGSNLASWPQSPCVYDQVNAGDLLGGIANSLAKLEEDFWYLESVDNL